MQGPESRHAWLINEAVEAPLQFPKNREMIFQLREALIATAEENTSTVGRVPHFMRHTWDRAAFGAPRVFAQDSEISDSNATTRNVECDGHRR